MRLSLAANLLNMVGAKGFEPSTPCAPSRRDAPHRVDPWAILDLIPTKYAQWTFVSVGFSLVVAGRVRDFPGRVEAAIQSLSINLTGSCGEQREGPEQPEPSITAHVCRCRTRGSNIAVHAGGTMGFHFRRSFRIHAGLQGTGVSFTDRTPTTPIRQGRDTPGGGMVAAFVLIGFLVVAIALFA